MTEAAHDDGATGPVALGGTPWRGTDVAEAQRVTLGELGADHWPVLPELPDRGPGADATGRSAALLQELAVDLQPHGWRVSPPGAAGSGRDRRRAVSLWHEDAHRWADTAGAEGAVVERLAVRVRGPLSLLAGLWLPGGERVLGDHGARRDVAESYLEGLQDDADHLGQRLVVVHHQDLGLAHPDLLVSAPPGAASGTGPGHRKFSGSAR